MSQQPQTTISEADLTRLLPTCQRCRRLRRKCDTQLPACRLCQKGKADCTFFDHALQQTLPRSYVHMLISRLERLRSVQAAVAGDQLAQPAYQPIQHNQHSRHDSAYSVRSTTQSDAAQAHQLHSYPAVSFDKHFVIKNANPTCWQFFGSSSPIALAVEVMVHARAKFGPVTHDLSYVGTEFALDSYEAEDQDPPLPRPKSARSEVESLVELYLSTTNVLHGYSDNETVVKEIDTYLKLHGCNPKALTGREAHQFFRVSLICAIGSANKSRHNPEYSAKAVQFYREGLQCIEEVTSDISSDSMQALLLLILIGFYYPRKIDIWKVLDYACRLSVELNYHSEPNDELEDERSRQLRRSLFWGLYCLERTIGQHYGRPSDLPEEIITAEYPATLNVLPFLDQPSQYSLVSHYYRLIYLRSEIFRELYMPASAPNVPHTWYEQRLDQILSWQREFQGIEHVPGMGTLTCRMGFETSVCFLFQPLLLRALAATKDAVLSPNCQEIIPRESYDAALRALSFYNEVLRAPPHTPEGDYPITIVTAHYTHQISFSILAYWLLVIDGRLPVIPFSAMPSDPTLMTAAARGQLTVHDVTEISNTCLFVLKQVADRFLGLVGMHDLFRTVRDKILDDLAQTT